jgi:ketosteroid isomerase-like protein
LQARVCARTRTGGMSFKTTSETDEAAVKAVIEAMAQAVRRRDVDAMLAQCSPDVTTFDLVPPLKHVGAEAVREIWAQTLESFEGPAEYEVHQLELIVSDFVAFARSLNRFGGKRADGQYAVNWLCFTLGLRKIDGQWKIVHQHASVPFDMKTGQALLDLEPEEHAALAAHGDLAG